MNKKWWHGKVAYQIYPKSFLDTNDDGIGDLKGIISKLDYLKDLGIDILWLSPIFVSPLADQGYDIADYYNIDPKFGTMEDMDELLAETKKRDMYVLMDLVVNHCSDEHEWFKKACENPDGKYGKYFYIEESKDGKLPTNWRSYFGGSVWDKLPGHEDKYYLHMFHKKQPDLNWENKEVRDEVYKMVNWWFAKGLAGFRVDAIINIKKDLPFRSYEADREDGMVSPSVMLENARGVGNFLAELRDTCFIPNDALTVGEVFDLKEEELLDFVGDNGYFSSIFDFSTTLIGQDRAGWYKNRKPSAKEYIDAIFTAQKKVENVAFLSNIIENHDEPRGVSHYISKEDLNDTSKKMLGLINIMLRGLPFIYQGQEIGMENTKFNNINEIDDIATIDQYEVCLRAGLDKEKALEVISEYSRDNARTPMQWDSSDNAGFTKGKAWLKVNENYKNINVETNIKNDDSVYNFYKKLIKIRKSKEYLELMTYAKMNRISVDDNIMAFTREFEDKKLLIIANYQKQETEFVLDANIKKILINNYEDLEIDNTLLKLKAYQALVLEI